MIHTTCHWEMKARTQAPVTQVHCYNLWNGTHGTHPTNVLPILWQFPAGVWMKMAPMGLHGRHACPPACCHISAMIVVDSNPVKEQASNKLFLLLVALVMVFCHRHRKVTKTVPLGKNWMEFSLRPVLYSENLAIWQVRPLVMVSAS